MDNIKRAQLLEELESIISLRRTSKAQTLNGFIGVYLKHLAQVTAPAFHEEIKEILGESIRYNGAPAQDSTISTHKSSIMSRTTRTTRKVIQHNEEGMVMDMVQGKEQGEIHATIHATNTLDTTPHKDPSQNDAPRTQYTENKPITKPNGREDDPPPPPVKNIIGNTQISGKNNYLTVDKKIELDKLNRILFIAPRGFSKSTLCSRFFPLWLACNGLKKDIFLVSATISLAKENLRVIRTELEANDKIIRDYGELKSDKWTEEHLVLRNGVSIRAKGREFQIRGFRPDLIICDDLEDDEVINSKEQRDKLENWFFRTLIPTLKPDQGLVYIGTKLHQMALIAKLEEKEEFLSRTYRALEEVNGELRSIWEEMWSTERLLKMKTEIGLYAFESEYQNNPLSLKEQPIKPHYLECKAKGEVILSCMAIDPAISEKDSADYRAIAIYGLTDKGYFKEIITEKGRWGIHEQIQRVLYLYKMFRPTRVLLEEVAFQKVLRTFLTDEARKQGIYLPISTAELGVGKNKRPKDKMTRLLQIIHLFEQQFVEITNPDTREELLSFPFGDYDDTVDTAVYSLYWLVNHRTGKVTPQKQNPVKLKTRDSYFVKEVRPGVYMAQMGEAPFPVIKGNFINYDKN
jgi:phage terminase large subunit-like protein